MTDKSLVQIIFGLGCLIIAFILPIVFYVFDVNNWLLGVGDVILAILGYLIISKGFYDNEDD